MNKRSIILPAIFCLLGNAYAEDTPLKQKVETVVKYIQRQPVKFFYGLETQEVYFIRENTSTTFTYCNNELRVAIPYWEDNKLKTIIFVDEEKNGYGNVDAICAKGEWIILTKKHQGIEVKATKAYASAIDKYLSHLEKKAENLEKVLEKVTE